VVAELGTVGEAVEQADTVQTFLLAIVDYQFVHKATQLQLEEQEQHVQLALIQYFHQSLLLEVVQVVQAVLVQHQRWLVVLAAAEAIQAMEEEQEILHQ
jgi:hypothetical protein